MKNIVIVGPPKTGKTTSINNMMRTEAVCQYSDVNGNICRATTITVAGEVVRLWDMSGSATDTRSSLIKDAQPDGALIFCDSDVAENMRRARQLREVVPEVCVHWIIQDPLPIDYDSDEHILNPGKGESLMGPLEILVGALLGKPPPPKICKSRQIWLMGNREKTVMYESFEDAVNALKMEATVVMVELPGGGRRELYKYIPDSGGPAHLYAKMDAWIEKVCEKDCRIEMCILHE